MISSPSSSKLAGQMEDTLSLSSMPISSLLDLFPKPPTTLPGSQKSTDRKTGKPEKKTGKFGSLLRTSFSGITSMASSSTGDLRKASISSGSGVSMGGGSLSTPASPVYPPSSQGDVPVSIEDDRLQYKLPPGLPERDYVDLLKRACKGVIAPKEQDLLFKFLLSLPPTQMKDFQKAVHDLLVESKGNSSKSKSALSAISETLGKGGGMILLDISKYYVDFNMKGRRAQMNETVKDSFVLEVKAGKVKYTIKPPEFTSGYELAVEPLAGKLKAKEKDEIKISVTVRRPVSISTMITIEVEGSNRHFICVNLSSEWSHFGCSLEDLEYVDDEVITGTKRNVPKLLQTLRQLLLKKNAYEAEEIFRKQLDEEKTMLARQQFDKGQHLDSMPSETLSTLIKVWFRELPERIFDVTVPEVTACDNEQKCLKLFEDNVKGRSLELAGWLFDLMAVILQNKEKNRMTSKKLAIVFAPNVFPLNAGSTSADYLRKQADVFFHVLERRLQQQKT